MSEPLNRRTFLGASAAATLGLRATAAPQNPSERVVVGIIGTGGRGLDHCNHFSNPKLGGVEVGYVCDVDQTRAEAAGARIQKATGRAPRVVTDFRRMLDDNNLNAVVVATCNHWHAPATIIACNAGKHVYVEKPCSHNPREGELMVTAARKNKCHVQMGNQRRSYEKIIEAMDELKKGVIGRAYYAQSYYTNSRPETGVAKAADVPKGLDWDLWQGPAPRRPYRTIYHPYKWHWFWHWGNGELGNNGIHYIDLCRWGLGVEFPIRVSSSGGRYRYQDDQETPDTHLVSFEFEGRKQIMWEGLSCNRLPGGRTPEITFHGDNGSLAISGGGYIVYDQQGKETRRVPGKPGDSPHIANFIAAIRTGARLNSEIEEGHKSTLLCHLGNIAHRTGRALRCDPKNGHIQGDKEAMALWSREYERGWEPRV